MTNHANNANGTNTPYYLPIKETAEYFNTSAYLIRKGVQDGTIKHMRSGKKIYIHIPALINTFNAMCGVDDCQVR